MNVKLAQTGQAAISRILIVEDDQLVANLYGSSFSRAGYQVKIGPDGQAGLDLVRRFCPDVVIVDLLLPKMTGLELIRTIRAEPTLAHLPVIVLSNAYLTSMMDQAWKAGATTCISKHHTNPEQVVEAVRHALSLKHAPATAPKASDPAPPALATGFAAPGDADEKFQAAVRQSLIERLPATRVALHTLLQGLIKADNEITRLEQLQGLYRRVHALNGEAGIAGVPRITRMSEALEALLMVLHEQPTATNASTLRTVASAIDCLGVLFERSVLPDKPEAAPVHVLVVGSEAISRRAATHGLAKAKLKPLEVEDPAAAYELLLDNRFDLVVLEADMPGTSGFELCTKLRSLPAHKETPVLFVTRLDDFESRVNSTTGGGCDFIGKPFLSIELAVKALVHVLRGQLRAAN